ncbi:MAG: regulatory protein RecX [Fimbriimonadaceae bacterium]|nr:regulatory protein RecX [Fimbriimonadaceae bacterium]
MTSRDRAFEIAWAAVGRSERTASELARHLTARGIEAADIDAVVARLIELGYVADGRVADDAVQSAKSGKPVGRDKVRAKLLSRGVDEAVVDEALGTMDHAGEVERATTLAAKLGTAAGPAKVARYLAARGFDEETVRDVVERLFPD